MHARLAVSHNMYQNQRVQVTGFQYQLDHFRVDFCFAEHVATHRPQVDRPQVDSPGQRVIDD